MDIIYKLYQDLSPKELEDALRLRQQVFIIEQNCFYEDIDGQDENANHCLFYDGNALAAYLRIFMPGKKYKKEASLGRIVVHPKYRGTGVGSKLIKKGIELCEGYPIRIEAQAALKGYYKNLGFREEGEEYVVDDILHLQMTLIRNDK